MFTQPLATVYKTKADYLLSGLTVCLLIRCFEEFSANQKIQGGLMWRHLSDSFWMGGSLRILKVGCPNKVFIKEKDMNKVLFSSERMDWETPNSLFNELNKEFNFTLDAASSDKNAKVKKHYTERENGLIQNWGGRNRLVQSALWQRTS